MKRIRISILLLLGMLTACGHSQELATDFPACANGADIVLMPHHLLVKPIIEEVYAALASADTQWEKIVIVSPDHFSQGASGVSTPALNEHGFTIHRDYVEQFFPGIPIEGWMIRTDATEEEVAQLVSELDQESKTLFIFSIDFSHYLPGGIANVHDLRSMDVLAAQDVEAARSLEVDSPIAVEILIRLLQARGEVLTDMHNTNPSRDIGVDTFDNTTHVFACSAQGKAPARTVQTALFFAHPREWYLGRTAEDRYLYGTDEALFDQGGMDHAVVNSGGTSTELDFDYFTE